jgi:hypothetical protein
VQALDWLYDINGVPQLVVSGLTEQNQLAIIMAPIGQSTEMLLARDGILPPANVYQLGASLIQVLAQVRFSQLSLLGEA